MTGATALDLAHAEMEENPSDDGARLRFYARMADTLLFVLLSAEPGAGPVTPQVFDLEDGRFVLAFDSEERLAAFTEAPAAYAAMPGRAIAQALAGQEIGLGLNLGVAPSAFLMPAGALDWLAQTLDLTPARARQQITGFGTPEGVPAEIVTSLRDRIARLAGAADAAFLVGAEYAGGARGHVLAVVGAAPGSEDAVAKAIGEAVALSGAEAGAIDVAFLAPDDPALAAMKEAGLGFELPRPAKMTDPAPGAPGTDPDRPPKLR